jgi:AcrR family transcriptional regulator
MTDTQPTSSVREVNDPVDGRTLRRTRNRTAVITALLDMIREGDLHPGAAEIAERAGVSHRSIFRYFDDLDDLVRTAIDQAFHDAEPLSRITDIGHGTHEDRIRVFVDGRLALFDYVNGPMQVARMRSATIPSIDEEIAVVAEAFRVQIAEHFATELDALPQADRDDIVSAILVLTSYDAYVIHTTLLENNRDHMRSSWNTALLTLLRT